MFVDDRAIFGCAKLHSSSTSLVTLGLQQIMEWLGCNGLQCNHDKTEFISFAPQSRDYLIGSLVTAIHPRTPTGSFTVHRSDII